MSTKTFIVPNISCGHCTSAIEEEVAEIEGVVAVSAEINTKRVQVEWESPATWNAINDLLHEINYPPQQLIQLS